MVVIYYYDEGMYGLTEGSGGSSAREYLRTKEEKT